MPRFRCGLSCASLLVAALLFPAPLRSQISEEEIKAMLAANELSAARARVKTACRQNPASAVAAYYCALLEENGETALTLFQEVARRFSTSEYAGRARYQIGQYYFARGNYRRAREAYWEVVRLFPASELAAPAAYHAAKALAILGENAAAQQELTAFLQQYPQSKLATLARQDLAELPPVRQAKPPAKISYTVQTGAFVQKSNAVAQQKRLRQAGYRASVSEKWEGNTKYYVVRVGEFRTREQARELAERLHRRHNLKGSVVQKEN
ncbi:MAG: SPOR domain-containing protein [candidate division KSB1 bacterium]|nr:SPOR domain-containing protein [candidate division KSB1 bacterium]MDZ7275245.1 SPOR domain-containing protein [candidate division KSB1 bacterium]MDZ7287413.1 SPOR domain-containing protein [candidate division KSB1 bacterium]MDZ7299527.1 SPOR domain-containing protein [candidate division KSB1 bacterium]MDZ7305428.1 SPOR domain-containing protein [candidate division KSB1 bacterium]